MPEKVLIVDDEEPARTGVAELVASWGYRTEMAKDGLEALDKVITWSPSIVVTDLAMPRMDGMELIQRLAEQPQELKVVVVTANTEISAAVEAMKMGAYDYITKPLDFKRLKAILQNASLLQDTERDVVFPAVVREILEREFPPNVAHNQKLVQHVTNQLRNDLYWSQEVVNLIKTIRRQQGRESHDRSVLPRHAHEAPLDLLER